METYMGAGRLRGSKVKWLVGCMEYMKEEKMGSTILLRFRGF